jgi:hypothetical protein
VVILQGPEVSLCCVFSWFKTNFWYSIGYTILYILYNCYVADIALYKVTLLSIGVMSSNVTLGKTTIQLEEETRDRLKSFGKKGESYDDIVIRLMDIVEGKVKK